MRRRHGLIAALALASVSLGSALAGAPVAHAQASDCETSTDLFDLPAQIARGRDLKILLSGGEGAQVFVASTGAPYPGTRVEPASPGVTRLIVPFRPGAQARIELTKAFGLGCIRQTSIVTPTAGVIPPARAHDEQLDTGSGKVRGILFEFLTPPNCFEALPLPVALGIRDGKKRYTFTAADPCLWETDVRDRRTDGWTFQKATNSVGDVLTAPFLTPAWHSGRHRLRYSFSVGGKPIRSGTITVRMGPADSPRFIYKGTDEFVNYCINRGKRISRRHGRLYCVRFFDDDRSNDYSVNISRDPRARGA